MYAVVDLGPQAPEEPLQYNGGYFPWPHVIYVLPSREEMIYTSDRLHEEGRMVCQMSPDDFWFRGDTIDTEDLDD